MRIALAFVVALVIAGCGGDKGDVKTVTSAGSTGPTATTPATPKPSAGRHDPLGCLEDLALRGARRNGAGRWRAFTPFEGIAIRIRKFHSAASARKAVARARVVAQQSGDYAVFGPRPSSDEGSVAAVANCLEAG